mgnify:CR=1 FL=1
MYTEVSTVKSRAIGLVLLIVHTEVERSYKMPNIKSNSCQQLSDFVLKYGKTVLVQTDDNIFKYRLQTILYEVFLMQLYSNVLLEVQ